MVDNIYKPGNIRTGIIVSRPSESIASVIYLEDAYQKYTNGQWTESEVLRSAADDLVRLHQQTARMEENPMLLKDYESYAAMIQPELLNKSQDPAFLEKYAYTYEQPDCIAAYTAQLNDHMKMRITNEILDVWGISKETLRENAIQNMPDPVFLPLWQVLRGQPEEPGCGHRRRRYLSLQEQGPVCGRFPVPLDQGDRHWLFRARHRHQHPDVLCGVKVHKLP